jgi:DNA-binding HxlR family transcriptional regulator
MSDSHLLETTPPWNVFDSNCPTRQVLDCIADKWTVLIIRRLAEGTLRFAQLRRAVDGISQKVLTNTLRALERDGICSWAEANIEQVLAAREVYPALP